MGRVTLPKTKSYKFMFIVFKSPVVWLLTNAIKGRLFLRLSNFLTHFALIVFALH